MKFFAVDHKRIVTEDIRCTSTVIWDVVPSDDNITIIVGLVSQDPQYENLPIDITLKFFKVECKRPTFGYIWPLSLKFFAVDHKRTGTEDIKCASTVIWDVVSSDENDIVIVVEKT